MKYRKILHGLDGSEGSFKACEHAVELASRFHAELHTISVEEVPHYPGMVGEVVESQQAAQGRYGQAMRRPADRRGAGRRTAMSRGHRP